MPVVAASQRGRPFLTSHCTPGRTVITRVNAKNTGPTIERIKYSPKVAAVAMVNTVKTTSPCVRVSPVRVAFGRSFAITACERLAAASCDLRVCIANDRLDMCLSNHGQARPRIMALRVWALQRCDRGFYGVACVGITTLRSRALAPAKKRRRRRSKPAG